MRIIAFAAALLFANVVAMAAPAAADPYWQELYSDNKFHCASQSWLNDGYNARGEACVVVNGNSVQAVAHAFNNEPVAHVIEAPHVMLYKDGSLIYDRFCYESALGIYDSASCFAPTLNYPCGTYVQARVTMRHGGFSRTWWSPTRQVCST
ncbi:hypothetical protein [Actinokineospora fastidiosa]|uniref:Uncharacterized protein n=1 Tax=Actinokineospora fastidiosa TaxID=1816 RepID=A0A918L9N8_9PSEU|nr:hypothetical protein [Actinokineospora fastidiosa]GGS22804.1 hypothetical protein GCM10010171_14560 [Actinokineospora fastidiosa]